MNCLFCVSIFRFSSVRESNFTVYRIQNDINWKEWIRSRLDSCLFWLLCVFFCCYGVLSPLALRVCMAVCFVWLFLSLDYCFRFAYNYSISITIRLRIIGDECFYLCENLCVCLIWITWVYWWWSLDRKKRALIETKWTTWVKYICRT